MSAYIAEFIFHVMPCELCIYQRYIYFTILLLSIIACIARKHNQIFLYLLSTCNTVGFLVSAFHSCVERGWIIYHAQCTGQISKDMSFEQMIAAIESAPVVLCNVIGPQVLGFSMANLGTILFVVLIMKSFVCIHEWRGLSK